MFSLGALKSKVSGMVNKFSGRKDFLEAVCASAALVASADGEITDAEVTKTVEVIKSNPSLSAAFKVSDIERTADAMLKRVQAGRTGRAGVLKEVQDVSSDKAMAEVVYLTALDVAEADGSIGTHEQAVLSKLANVLGVTPSALTI